MALFNSMETIVDNALNTLLKSDSECCKCEQCIEDMKCLALNSLPPKYVSTEKGELFSKISLMIQQSSIDVQVACLSAIEFVKERPRHDVSEKKN